LSHLLYKLFLISYSLGVRFVALWNAKAKEWIVGRKEFPKLFKTNDSKKRIWMHCASLGEFEQGRPVLEELKKQYDDVEIILTFFSPSGYRVCKNYKTADAIFYLPIDSKANAINFLDAIQPNLVLWVKYEYWYNYLNEIKNRNIPLLLVSGVFRNNQPFFKWYGSLWKEMINKFSFLFVQNDKSLRLAKQISATNSIAIAGDTRFDRVVAIANNFDPLPIIERYCGDCKVFVGGSTWAEDEEEILHYVKTHPQIKFIIAPHEVDAENIKEVQKRFSNSILYSQLTTINHQPSIFNCLIIDNIGMLSRLYYYADVCYIGGGFGDDGVHNVLEAAVYGKPILFGTEYDKYKEAIDLIEVGAAISIEDALTLEKELDEIFTNENVCTKMGMASLNYVNENKGATKKILDYIYENRLLIN
jgi:3-deoxy-D-manno-octulosonic-acid transferase